MALLARQRVFPARRFELRVFAFRPRKQLRHQGFLPLPPLILNRCVSDLPPPDSLNQPWVKVLGLNPLFEICSPLKRKRLDDSQGQPGPGGEANAPLPVCSAQIPQETHQKTHQVAPSPRLVSPPPSADRARKNPTPTKLTIRTKLTMRVNSEGTALRAAAVAASVRRTRTRTRTLIRSLSLSPTLTLTLT